MELLSSLYKLQRRGALCDVSLLSIEGCSVPVHTVILAAASSTICGRIVNRGGFQSITTNLPESTLQGIVRYIYTGLGAEDSEIQYAIQNLGIDVVSSVSLASTSIQTDSIGGFPEALDLVMSASQASASTQTDEVLVAQPRPKSQADGDSDDLYINGEGQLDTSRIKSEMCDDDTTEYDTDGYADLSTAPNEGSEEGQSEGMNMLSEAVLQEQAQEVLQAATEKQKPEAQPVIHKCKFCDEIFNDTVKFKRHKSDHAQEMLTCNICARTLKGAFRMRQHMQSHAAMKIPRPRKPNSKAAIRERKKNMPRIYPCLSCGDRFQTLRQLHRHKVRKHKAPNDSIFCKQCDKSFRDAKQLRHHMKTHNSLKRFHICDICGHTFRRSENLHLHMDIHETQFADNKRYMCKQCNLYFKTTAQYKTHMRTHTSERPFPCEICGKPFRTKAHLDYHKNSHSDVKAYHCKMCNNYFKTLGSLRCHERIHTGEKPYKCATCGKSFTQASTLMKHERIHSDERPFGCKQCGKTFKRKEYLKEHNMIHAGIKPHACDVCGKAFVTKFNLKEHRYIHTGERPYVCTYCNKGFNSHTTLKKHIGTHTGQSSSKSKARAQNAAARSTAASMTTTQNMTTAPQNLSTAQNLTTPMIQEHPLEAHTQAHSQPQAHAAAQLQLPRPISSPTMEQPQQLQLPRVASPALIHRPNVTSPPSAIEQPHQAHQVPLSSRVASPNVASLMQLHGMAAPQSVVTSLQQPQLAHSGSSLHTVHGMAPQLQQLGVSQMQHPGMASYVQQPVFPNPNFML